jgi:hypothetical protein
MNSKREIAKLTSTFETTIEDLTPSLQAASAAAHEFEKAAALCAPM